jgi:serine/threonine-protein kinase
MKMPGPLLTLAAGAVTGAVLLVMSHSAANPGGSAAAAAKAPAAKAAAAKPPAAKPAAAPAAEALPALTPSAAPAQAPAPAPAAAAAAAADGGEITAYAGRLPGGKLSLQLAIRGDRAVAYVCDGATIEVWLQGGADGRTVTLTGQDGDRATATLSTGKAAVELTALGRTWSFRVSAVEPGSVPAVTKKLTR